MIIQCLNSFLQKKDTIEYIIIKRKNLCTFKISDDLKNLNTKNIKNNLLQYKYDNKNLKKLIRKKVDEESLSYISAYSSFKGEIFENVVYELLLEYANKNEEITQFILKGPHQKSHYKYNNKSGLLIDKSLQIVYKSAYKDISEYDAMFFTKNSIYFVEMSTSKKTASLNKRLNKKHALLKVLFPKLQIKALIVLTEGSTGLRRFPEYATIWITKEFNDDKLLKEILYKKDLNSNINYFKHKKFIQTSDVKYERFQYFQTLEWILNKSRSNKRFVIDLSFFTSKVLSLYFDIFTKLYIGYLDIKEFKKLVPSYEAEILKVVVSLEKINSKKYDIVYYVKNVNKKLYRVYVDENGDVSIKQKEPDGFTNAEVRFLLHILKTNHELNNKNIGITQKNITKFIK